VRNTKSRKRLETIQYNLFYFNQAQIGTIHLAAQTCVWSTDYKWGQEGFSRHKALGTSRDFRMIDVYSQKQGPPNHGRQVESRPRRHSVNNEKWYFYELLPYLAECNNIPKQSYFVRCPAIELLHNSLCGPLTRKFGGPCIGVIEQAVLELSSPPSPWRSRTGTSGYRESRGLWKRFWQLQVEQRPCQHICHDRRSCKARAQGTWGRGANRHPRRDKYKNRAPVSISVLVLFWLSVGCCYLRFSEYLPVI